MVGDITDIYVNNFQKMMQDENFTVEELSAIAFGYTKLLEESTDVLTELKNVVNITTLSMTDKERMEVVDKCYNDMKRYRNRTSVPRRKTTLTVCSDSMAMQVSVTGKYPEGESRV